MSTDYDPIDPEMLPEGTASERVVREELTAVESLLSSATGTDEYLEAIVRNQRVQLMQSGGSFGPPAAGSIPTGVLGTTLETINEQQTGDVLFDIAGTKRVYTFRSDEDIAEGQTIRVRDDGLIELLENQSAAEGNTLSSIFSGEQTLTSDSFTNISWGFRASTVTVINDTAETANSPVTFELRFKDPDESASDITLTPDDRSISLSGTNGIGAKSVWLRQTDADEDRRVRVIAVE